MFAVLLYSAMAELLVDAEWLHDTNRASTPFEQPPLPLREFQVASIVSATCLMGSSWPPTSGSEPSVPIEEKIAASEQTEDPIDLKNARILGMLAAIHSIDLTSNLTLKNWGLAPHLGMLNALGAALTSGLPLTEMSLTAAVSLQLSAIGHQGPQDISDAYVSPRHSQLMHGMQKIIHLHAVAASRAGIQSFVEYHTDPLDMQLDILPPGKQVLTSYAQESNPPPAFGLYTQILRQVHETRDSIYDSQLEIEKMLMRGIGEYNLHRRVRRNRQGSKNLHDGIFSLHDDAYSFFGN